MSDRQEDQPNHNNNNISHHQNGSVTIMNKEQQQREPYSLWQWLQSAQRQLVVLLVPIVFLPLLLTFHQAKEASCAYVVIVMGIFWMTEILPLAVTALLPVILYPALGILDASEVSAVYLSDSNFVFVGSLIMAVAIEYSNLHERIALRILLLTGSNPRWLMLGFQVATCILSMWISNTATTAMMVPIAMAVIYELHEFSRSTSIAADSTVLHLDALEESAIEFNVNQLPTKERNVYKALMLSICYAASIGGTGTLIGTGPNIVLSGDLDKLYKGKTEVTFASWIIFSTPQMVLALVFSWIWLQALFIGFKKENANEKPMNKRVNRMLRKKYERLGKMRYQPLTLANSYWLTFASDVFDERVVLFLFILLALLWLFREPKVIPGWSQFFEPGYVSDGSTAMFVAFLLFVVPSENPFRRKTTAYSTLMNWDRMKEKFSWSTVLLLGGGYAMASGVEESGLSQLMGDHMASLTFLPQWAFIGISCLIITFLTEFSSNVATASIFIPIVASIARQQHTNPLLFILPATLSCSYSFTLPAGTPPNAIVFSSGLLRVIDMAKAGVVLNLFAFLMTMILTHTWTWWLFDLGNVPAWADTVYNRTHSHHHH